MRCCVPNCKNDSRHISKSQGITFHVFPNESSLRTAWLKSLGKEGWEPKDRSAVCSEHFLCEDLYETKNGLRKVRTGAVPLILQDSINCDYGEPASLKFASSSVEPKAALSMMTIKVKKTTTLIEPNISRNIDPLSNEDVVPQEPSRTAKLLPCNIPAVRTLQKMEKFVRTVQEQRKKMKVLHQTCRRLKQKVHTYQNIINVKNLRNEVPIKPITALKSTCPIYSHVCRICLVMDKRLIPIRMYKLEQAYKNLTGISLCEEDKLPQKLCMECAQRLINCNRFRHKSLRANSLMLEVIKKQDCLTSQNIKTINRENNQLDSTLSQKHFEPDHYDAYIEYEDPPVKITDENTPQEETVEIKLENAIYLITEEIPDKNDITDVTEVNDVDSVTSDREYNIMSDKDHYSSDDSLPLDKCKTKKGKKRKDLEDKPVKAAKRVKKIDAVEPKIDRRRKPFLNDDLNETLFTITDLTIEEQIAEIVKRQESANYKNSVFKCSECFKGFLDEDAYNSHMTRHTDQCGEHECEVCKTHFKHPHALRKHITAHHTQRFSCKQCTYVTTHRQTARLHERWHKGTKYRCPHCQDEFVKFTTYMGHIRIKHPSDFVCELCGYSFVSAKGIELHKKLKHRLENSQIPEDGPLCEPCNVRFASSEAHKRHLSVSARHFNRETREPNKPKKGRKSKESKENERRAREKDKDTDEKRRIYPSQMRKAEGPIPCEQCGLQLEDSRAYHGHFRRMHPDKNRTNYPSMKSPCMCEVCGRMFQSYALLKDHRWVHTGERPFKCDSCGKSFRMKQRLVAHRRVHSQVRASYVCDLCGKHFSTHSNRQRHMFIHTGLKPFKCEMCGKGFKHASEKRAHITYVHLKKPWPKRARGKRRPETRQGQLQPQQGPDMDISTPLWSQCDPKLGDNPLIEDRPVYYNLKI